MASVNWYKVKSVNEAKAIERHNERSELDEVNHSNEHIDKNLTHLNTILFSEPGKMDEYLSAIDEYNESVGKRKRRSDAVVSINLETTFPKGDLTEDDKIEFCREITRFMFEKFNNNTLTHCSIHRDEIHEYLNAENEKVMSEEHVHADFIPVRKNEDGSLQMIGSDLVVKSTMIELNTRLNDWSIERGFTYNTGSKKRGVKVEQLKRESKERLFDTLDAQTETIEQQAIEIGVLARENADLKRLLEESDKEAENSALERENANLRAQMAELDEQACKIVDKLNNKNVELKAVIEKLIAERDVANAELEQLKRVKIEQPQKQKHKNNAFDEQLKAIDNYGKRQSVNYDFSR